MTVNESDGRFHCRRDLFYRANELIFKVLRRVVEHCFLTLSRLTGKQVDGFLVVAVTHNNSWPNHDLLDACVSLHRLGIIIQTALPKNFIRILTLSLIVAF